jgi:hypothetical protein
MRIQLIGIAVAGLFAGGAGAQSTSQKPAGVTPVGTWRGTSVCLVHPSPCKDEIVVYRITSMKAADSVAIDARKVVRGEEQEMGILLCHTLNGQLTCTIPHGIWHFSVRRDSLVGETASENLAPCTSSRDLPTMAGCLWTARRLR